MQECHWPGLRRTLAALLDRGSCPNHAHRPVRTMRNVWYRYRDPSTAAGSDQQESAARPTSYPIGSERLGRSGAPDNAGTTHSPSLSSPR